MNPSGLDVDSNSLIYIFQKSLHMRVRILSKPLYNNFDRIPWETDSRNFDKKLNFCR